MDLQDKVSAEEKLNVCRRLLCVAQTANCYTEDKKTLKKLVAVVKRERKAHAKTSYPLTEEHSSQIEELILMLFRSVKRLRKARTMLDYREGMQTLADTLRLLEEQIQADSDELLNYAREQDSAQAGESQKKNGRRQLKIGIVYSGAVSKSAYQIGFTKSLLKYVDRSEIKLISGASMGMLVGYALAANKLDMFESLFRNIKTGKMATLLWKVVTEHLFDKGFKAFARPQDELDIPLTFPVCYIPLLSVRYYWIVGQHNPVWNRYIYAGTNLPFVTLHPSFLRGRLAIDGGAADNIPLYPLLARHKEYVADGLDLIIVMHFDARYDYRRDFVTDVPILELDLAICNGFSKHHYNFSADYVDEMILAAMEYGDKICDRLFSTDCSPSELRRVINEIFLEEHESRQQNISVDRLVTMLNTIAKALRNDSKCNKDLYLTVNSDKKRRKRRN